jgi:hypothetical protein
MSNEFDRLVDGELSPEEYRALLASLDDAPDGWRNCALAFLEAQALATEIGGVRRGLRLSDDEKAETRPVSLPKRRFHVPTLLAIAASFVIAFGLGVSGPQFFRPGPQENPLAGNNQQSGSAIASANGTDQDGVRHQVFRPIGNVKLVMDGPGGESAEAAEVPVYEVGQYLEQFLSERQPAVSPELVQLLRQSGHEVERQQQLMPAQLEDGRQIIVPIERYQITPVSRRAY